MLIYLPCLVQDHIAYAIIDQNRNVWLILVQQRGDSD